MQLALAFGGDDPHWLHLADIDRSRWAQLIGVDREVVLQELHAHSASGDLMHPGEVPLPSRLTLTELLDMVSGELGNDAKIVDVRLLLQREPLLAFLAHDERSVRFEAAHDDILAAVLERFSPTGGTGWRALLRFLRHEAMTSRPLRVAVTDMRATVRVYRTERSRELDRPEETVEMALGA